MSLQNFPLHGVIAINYYFHAQKGCSESTWPSTLDILSYSYPVPGHSGNEKIVKKIRSRTFYVVNGMNYYLLMLRNDKFSCPLQIRMRVRQEVTIPRTVSGGVQLGLISSLLPVDQKKSGTAARALPRNLRQQSSGSTASCSDPATSYINTVLLQKYFLGAWSLI